jgi:Tfp pilus assembly protein PilZ
VNLNAGGMFIATETLFPVNTYLTLEINLPGFKSPLQVAARVAWVNHPEWLKKSSMPYGLGVQFSAPGATFKAALQAFLEAKRAA